MMDGVDGDQRSGEVDAQFRECWLRSPGPSTKLKDGAERGVGVLHQLDQALAARPIRKRRCEGTFQA
jgi:hypothetical protein